MLGIGVLLGGVTAGSAGSVQNTVLHPTLSHGIYQDEKIRVAIPARWTAKIDVQPATVERGGSPAIALGLVLRKGKYILTLCSECMQVSGIFGGRFYEVAGLVQPWYRSNPDIWTPCGEPEAVPVSDVVSRTDFWYRREAHRPPDPDGTACNQPQTDATVWYGSLFVNSCVGVPKNQNCGGWFLTRGWLLDKSTADDLDEMAFGLSYDTMDPNQLPHRGDADLKKVLAEASGIVRSVKFSAVGNVLEH
jgi:hypothetical protein